MKSFFIHKFTQLAGLFSLFLFLVLHFFFVSVIFFAPKETVHALVDLQKSPWVFVAELALVSVPLLAHVVFNMMRFMKSSIVVRHDVHAGHVRYALQRITGVIVFVFLLFHLYHSFTAYFGIYPGHQYFREIMLAHGSFLWSGLYWAALLCAGFYLANGSWSLFIDWGVTAGARSQKLSFALCGFIFVVWGALVGWLASLQFWLNIRGD